MLGGLRDILPLAGVASILLVPYFYGSCGSTCYQYQYGTTVPGYDVIILVSDAATGGVMPDVLVHIEGPISTCGYTDSEGRIIFTNAPSGTYRISVTAAGYQTTVITRRVPMDGMQFGFSLTPGSSPTPAVPLFVAPLVFSAAVILPLMMLWRRFVPARRRFREAKGYDEKWSLSSAQPTL